MGRKKVAGAEGTGPGRSEGGGGGSRRIGGGRNIRRERQRISGELRNGRT